MSKNIDRAASSAVSDAIALFAPGLPTASLANAIESTIHTLLRKRNDQAFELLLEEIRDGIFPSRTEEDISDLLGMMLRYQRAAIEGSAKINLRIMARVFKGLCQKDVIYPEKFQNFANRIADLTIEEIQTIALVYQYKTEIEKHKPFGFEQCDKIAERVFGQQIKNPSNLLAHCAAASRTGLVMHQGDLNLFAYTTTPIMDELVGLTEFQKILDESSSFVKK